MDFDETPQFQKEFKKLFRKYKTLDQDLTTFKQLIAKLINLAITQKFRHHNILHTNDLRTIFIFKSRLHCRALKRDSLRLIYAYQPTKTKITFIEIYFKGNKVIEDTSRWQTFLSTIQGPTS